MRHEHEATAKELEALKSGKAESRSIAESAEIHSATSDNWKQRYEELSTLTEDLITLLRYNDANTAPPPEIAQRVRYKLGGRPLQNGVPPAAVKS